MSHTAYIRDADLLVRRAGPTDTAELERLAALDSARLPGGPVLLAETGGRLLAAVAIESGDAIADPFAPTASVLELLKLRSAQLRATDGAEPTGHGGLDRLRALLSY